MKYLFLILLVAALLWIVSIAWTNRRKPPHANRDSGGSGGDSGGSSSSSCGSSDSACGGGDGGGGD
jgi:hypothetical protein